MATLETTGARPFARATRMDVDAMLQSSDQTMTSARLPTSGLLLVPARRHGIAMAMPDATYRATGLGMGPSPRRRRGRSTYFPDSTDDDAPHAHAPSQPTRKTRAAVRHADFPLVHVGSIEFPATRSVLWDRRILGASVKIALADISYLLVVPHAVLQRVLTLYRQQRPQAAEMETKTEASPYPMAAFASRQLGALAGPRGQLDTCMLVATRMVEMMQPHDDRAEWRVPVFHTAYPESRSSHGDQDGRLAARMRKWAAVDHTCTSVAQDMDARVLVTTPRNANRAELCVQIEAFLPSASFRFGMIRNLPLLMTPLASSLSRGEFGGALRWGFLTLDRARKAVPLLPSDPLVQQRPVVGVWVYGVPFEQDHVQYDHSFLYQCCCKFLLCEAIHERVFVSAETFLVAVYAGESISASSNSGSGGPLPRFLECHCEMERSETSSVTWQQCHAQVSCLAGLASFQEDIELRLAGAGSTLPSAARGRASASSDAHGSDEETPRLERHPRVGRAALTRHSSGASDSSESKVQSENDESADLADRTNRMRPRTAAGQDDEGAEHRRFGQDPITLGQAASTRTRTDTASRPQARNADRATTFPREPEESKETVDAVPPPESWHPSQQLLSLQHQHILENQQRQLRELQAQIEHLQRLLVATQEENARLTSSQHSSAGSSSSHDNAMATSDLEVDATDVVAGAAGQQPLQTVQPEDASREDVAARPIKGGTAATRYDELQPATRVETQATIATDGSEDRLGHDVTSHELEEKHDEENEDEEMKDDEDEDSCASSLHLSAISQHSDASIVSSSFSSSLVGDRLKQIMNQGHHDTSTPICPPSRVAIESGRADEHKAGEVEVNAGTQHAWDGDMRAYPVQIQVGADRREEPPMQLSRLAPAPTMTRTTAAQTDTPSKRSESSDDTSSVDAMPVERLVVPRTPDKGLEGSSILSGCGSFCIPRIKYTPDTSAASDSEDDEIRHIEAKYRRRYR